MKVTGVIPGGGEVRRLCVIPWGWGGGGGRNVPMLVPKQKLVPAGVGKDTRLRVAPNRSIMIKPAGFPAKQPSSSLRENR